MKTKYKVLIIACFILLLCELLLIMKSAVRVANHITELESECIAKKIALGVERKDIIVEKGSCYASNYSYRR